MTKEEIRILVNEGFEQDRILKAAEKRVKEIGDRLKKEAGDEKVTFVGTGCQAVIGSGCKLVAQIGDEATLEKAKELSGKHFKVLFRYAPVQKFKDVVKALLGIEDAAGGEKLIQLLEGEPYKTCQFKSVE